MVYAKLVSNEEKIEEVNEILREVFINEMKYKEEDIFDISNNQVFHVLLYEGLKEDKAIATGRLLIKNSKAYIKWIAVRKNYRKRLYGDMIVRMLIGKAKDLSINEIFTEVPVNLQETFQKMGFENMENKVKKDINDIKYVIMKYNNQPLNCCQKTENKNVH